MKRIPDALESNFDLVGTYEQDKINGFSEDTIVQMFELAQLQGTETILDCMAGDGNLTERLFSYGNARGMDLPLASILEFSRIQSEFARKRLEKYKVQVVWGDIVECIDRHTGDPLPEAQYDRVLIKSANHEIPRHLQQRFADNLNQLLKPNGLLINLGFLLDNEIERDEFARFTRVKDGLAGMQMLVENRHFLMRSEYYAFLEQAGFEVIDSRPIEYTIDSRIVAEQYFPADFMEEYHLSFQAAQLEAVTMRKNGRISFTGNGSIMKIPGEITVARRSPSKKKVARIYAEYPYTLVRSMRCHAELRQAVCAQVLPGSAVLDLGCGPGFLATDLVARSVSYTGVDSNERFIEFARKNGMPSQEFLIGDLTQKLDFRNSFDFVCMLNVLYQDSLDVQSALRNACSYTRPGGKICVAGPLRKSSFNNIAAKIHADLLADGVQFSDDEYQAIIQSNKRLLNGAGNYWSIEGIVNLLGAVGFHKAVCVNTDYYYGESYFVVAEKG